MPGWQRVQAVAPVPLPVSVIEPAPHAMHPTVEAAENWPASHCVQALPPGSASVLVTEPASQTAQAAAVVANWPASHGVQAPSLTRALKQHVIPSLALVEPPGQLGLQEKASLDDCVIVQDEKKVPPSTARKW